MIDIHNVVSEVENTLLSSSNTTLLSDLYDTASDKVLRLAAVEDVLYAYLVCQFPRLSDPVLI